MDSDFNRPDKLQNLNDSKQDKVSETQQQTNATDPKTKKHKGIKITLIAILVVGLLGGIGYGVWYHSSTKSKEINNKNTQIKTLQTELAKSKAENKALTSKLAASGIVTTTETTVTTESSLSQEDKENIILSITSRNTAALEQKMNTSVLVILAASEGMGQRTPAQAISDLDYVTSAQQPWNFSPSAATLTKYQSGGYAQYFPNGAIVGISADGKVVSFTINSSGKISTIFMSASAEML